MDGNYPPNPSQTRHHHVENNSVEAGGLGGVEAFDAVARQSNCVVLLFESLTQQLAH